MSPIHTGSCAAVAGETHVRQASRGPEGSRVYCLHDPDGRPLGRIEAPVGRPALGRKAATVYLRRDQRTAIQ